MRRFLSMALSIVMTITIMLALPVSAQAESTEGIAPADIKIINDDYNDLFDSFEKGAGYINLIENEETGENVEIVNLFHSEAVTPHKGVTYDLATNTLTLDNVNGGSWKILCDQMLHLKINVKGPCSIGSFSFWDTYPDFIGTGTLTVNEGIGGAVNNNISAKGIKPVSVSNTVTLTLKAGKGNPAANLNVLSDKNIYDTANLISYAGKVSDPLNWEKKEEFGGPSNDWISLRGVRVRTVFKATEILKKNDYTGNDNYYIKSISHVGNEPMTYHHISQLVLKDGVWVEKDDGNNYWSKDELFTNYTAAEVASLPSSLVNSEGNATAYLSTQFDYGQAYIKDNIWIIEGYIRWK